MARLDLNKDGYLSRENYEHMAKKLAEYGQLTKEQAESVHEGCMRIADETLDLKPTVKIPLQEAVQRASKTLLARSPEQRKARIYDGVLGKLFDVLDTNKDGHISPGEFKVYFKVIAPEMTEAEVTHSFETIDTNQNGEISWEEFLAAAEDFLYGLEETEVSKVFFGPLLD